MKKTYFNAIALSGKPFISWMSVGSFTSEEFAASEYAGDPLVITEDKIPLPYNVFGVCPLKIDAGVLVNRTPAEMAVFETEYNIYLGVKSEPARLGDINNETFNYDRQSFPMDEVARLFYTAFEKVGTGDQKIRTMANELYTLALLDIPNFMTAYYTRLLTVSKHTI